MITFFDLKIVTLITLITIGSGMLGLAGDKEPAFSQQGPGDTPVVLGPGLISAPDHIEMGFRSTPDGQVICGNIKLSATLLNKSNYYSATCDMHVYLSLQTKITRKSILLGTVAATSLRPGKKVRLKLTFTIPGDLKQKEYYFFMSHDQEDHNQDPIDTNNIWVGGKKLMFC